MSEKIELPLVFNTLAASEVTFGDGMRYLITFGMVASTLGQPAFSADVEGACQQILDNLIAEYPTNYRDCGYTIAEPEMLACEVPDGILSGKPTSHMILAIDASGSMAGPIDGRSKMEVAKAEARSFLSEMPEDVQVGLVVYGHKGSNQEADKAESCAASELVHAFGASRQDLEASVAQLSPTGFTPLAGALEYAGEIIGNLSPPREGDLAPVIYMLSDGKETCEGDPVAAAASLFEGGVQTIVNTIGFAVDAETAFQLEAIADAAGGRYYPADTVNALNAQLRAIRESEGKVARYEYCRGQNMARVLIPFQRAQRELASCFNPRNPQKLQSALVRASRQDGISDACEAMLFDYAINEIDAQSGLWNLEQVRTIQEQADAALDAYDQSSRLDTVMADQ